MDYAKRPVAVIPDACTLIYASLDDGREDNGSNRNIQACKDLMHLIKRYDVGVVTEHILENAAHTDIVKSFTEAEKRNFSKVVKGIRHVDYSDTQVRANTDMVDRIYEKARAAFEEKVGDILDSHEDLKRSRKAGRVSKRRMKRWAKNVGRKLNSPSYGMVRKKLFESPPDSNDKYLLSLGYILRDEYDKVFIATDDTHMCPVFGCDSFGYVINKEIVWRLGIRLLQPLYVYRGVRTVLRNAGVLEGQS